MNVLSLFDGMSCGQQALERAGIKVDKYFASEIDKHAIKVTMANYPDTIQLGSVIDVDIKTTLLSEVYQYICENYFNNDIHSLQGVIPEWEMLHRINQSQTFFSYFGPQVQVETSKTSKDTTLSINDRIWFYKCEVDGHKGVYDIIRGGNRRAITNKIDVGDLCKYSFWWNGDGQQEFRTEEKGIAGNDGKSGKGINKRNPEKCGNKPIFNTRSEKSSKEKGFGAVSRPSKKTKLPKCNVEIKQEGYCIEENRNRTKKEGIEVCRDAQALHAHNEVNGTFGVNRVLLPIYKKIQVTIIKCEWGVIITKGCLSATLGGSPCQSFSFAGKRKGMSTKCETEILTLDQYLQLKNDGFEFEGQSYLFWEYMRILNEVKPKYFLLENVMMGEKWERILSKAIGVNPIEINSALVSAQNRRRLYWTNIGMVPGGLFGDLESIIKQPKDKSILLKDILEREVDSKYFLSEKSIQGLMKHKAEQKEKGYGFGAVIKNGDEKMNALKIGGSGVDDLIVHNTMPRSSTTGKGETGPLSRNDGKTYFLDTGQTNAVEISSIMLGRSKEWGNPENSNGKHYTLCKNEPHGIRTNSMIRRLTPIECERLQTVKDNYTNHVSDSQRYKMLGNGWTVDVITHILKHINL